jgi:hypothetical protein
MLQVRSVPLVLPPKKAEATETCPLCGGPAEIDLFWSTSLDQPGVRVLKRQICCGGRRGRPSRFRTAEVPRCPVQVEILEREEPQEPLFPPESLSARLDAAVQLLASLDEQECRQLVQLARVTRQLARQKAELQQKLSYG